jgi:hypothetical protein
MHYRLGAKVVALDRPLLESIIKMLSDLKKFRRRRSFVTGS